MNKCIYHKKKSLNLNGRLFDLTQPMVMGILNVTPDSFYDGGQFSRSADLLAQIHRMVDEGVDIFDVGAYSSRPGADDVSVEDELKRLLPALALIREHYPDLPISVDTFRSEVADEVITQYGVEIINDISGGELDEHMFDVIAKHKVVYVMMHMKGTPKTMTSLNHYDNLLADILTYFPEKLAVLKSKGVKDIIIDPGFGFAKDVDQNYELLSQLNVLDALEVPVLIGVSRKSMIYRLLGVSAAESLNGTSAVHMLALSRGANVLRVHDVRAARECIEIYKKIQRA